MLYLAYVAGLTLVVEVLAIAVVTASAPLVEPVAANLAVSQPDHWCNVAASRGVWCM
ncbi:hypothetical protein [Mycobacterium lepromatosis]|uniref:hypothetical protein n=1 Tax=Mycobacterium lepromatosis TaxID=480418 RepID=UPI000B24B3EE|nr:hypothetical protein [Mycobacterium lepromatosis]